MKHGDLSNRSAPTIAFRVDGFLITREEKKFFDKVKNVFKGNFDMSGLNEEVTSAITYIFRHTDMNSYLIIETESSTLNNYELELLESVDYSQIVNLRKPVDITRKLMTGEYAYYVDNNEERMSLVNHNKCITLGELKKIIRG